MSLSLITFVIGWFIGGWYESWDKCWYPYDFQARYLYLVSHGINMIVEYQYPVSADLKLIFGFLISWDLCKTFSVMLQKIMIFIENTKKLDWVQLSHNPRKFLLFLFLCLCIVVVSVIIVIISSLVKLRSIIAEIYLLFLLLFCCCWW